MVAADAGGSVLREDAGGSVLREDAGGSVLRGDAGGSVVGEDAGSVVRRDDAGVPEGDDAGLAEDPDGGSSGSTICGALGFREMRFQGELTSGGSPCSTWALTTIPAGGLTRHTYRLARAELDSVHPGRTTDSVVLIAGDLNVTSCEVDSLRQTADIDGSGTGPVPYGETSFTAHKLVISGAPARITITVSTHNSAGTVVECSGSLFEE